MSSTILRVRRGLPGVVLAVALTACGGGGDGGGGSGAGDPAGAGGYSVLLGADPENPLVPGNTTESEGTQVLTSLFTPLVGYDPETAELEYTGVAESISSPDNTTWTVRLQDGWTFHDGTPVTASSFVDAWNHTANTANGFGGASFFSNIVGYDPVEPVEAMEGLRVVDDRTFEVTLAEPFSQFPLTTGYMTFAPLPQAFFDDPEGFGRRPVGNGPFRADGEFVPGQGITVSRYDGYAGDDAPVADSVEFRVIPDINTAYNELLAGNLDVLRPSIPNELIPTAEQELGDRFVEREAAGFDYFGFPTYDPRFDDADVRRAFSMAIDRETIVEAVFDGSREPAYDVIPPVIEGHRPDACEYCRYDPARAAELLAGTGFDTSQPVDLWFNSGAGHDQWVQAVGNQLRQNLGVDYRLRELAFGEYLPLMEEKGITGPFRLGWGMDYPSPQNFLEPLFATSALPPAGANRVFYSNPEFDRLVAEANRAETPERAVELYQQADDVLLGDMPIAPLWFDKTQGAHSEDVTDVSFDAFQRVVLTQVRPVA